ncbi:MAG: FMN-binding protein [Ruminococcaceae bacterium]|nr:FMN-binding protein [Oscillospiraceae bacterium]
MKDSVKSVVVITSICLIIAALLGVTNYFTAPDIEKGEKQRAADLCMQLLPGASDFVEFQTDALYNLPETITAIYQETHGAGYVFQITTKGYEPGLVIMCGISSDGKIVQTKTLSSSETKTIGGKTESEAYTSQYVGLDADFADKVDAVSGATITSTAYEKAIADAFVAFKVVSGN